MCSVNEIEQAGDTIKSKKGAKRREKQNTPNVLEKGSCMKCPEKAVVLVRNNDPFCRTCFLEYIVHKFRATIGKARVIYQGEKVLLAVSGGSSSSAMLDLVIKGECNVVVRSTNRLTLTVLSSSIVADKLCYRIRKVPFNIMKSILLYLEISLDE